MKMLCLTKYNFLGASSRLRIMQYVPALSQAGFDITTSYLFSDAYVESIQSQNQNLIEIIRAYFRRIGTLAFIRNFNVVWIEKELLPWIPACIELNFYSDSPVFVLDIDDAVFHIYDQNPSYLVRKIFRNKYRKLMRRVALTIVGNGYLEEYASSAGARQVELIPTVVDLERYRLDRFSVKPSSARPSICWIGQRSTAKYLMPLASVFARLQREGSAEFYAIGIDPVDLGLPMKGIVWTAETEVQRIATFDIGIMPLEDGLFERGKCGYKLVQYMACGLPVVASPVGINKFLVRNGVNGFLAETPEDWYWALTTLLREPALRQRMGESGRALVESELCLQVTAPKLVSLIEKVALNRS